MSNKERVIIVLSDAGSTEPYIRVLKEHNINLGAFTNGKNVKSNSALAKELRKHNDEESRVLNSQMYETLNFILGTVETRRKEKGLHLNTPRSIMTSVQKYKEEVMKENGIHGLVQAFIINALDADLSNAKKVPILPQTEFRKNVPAEVRMEVLKALVSPVLVEGIAPPEIDIKKIAEKVLKKNQNLAEENLVIRVIKDFLEQL